MTSSATPAEPDRPARRFVYDCPLRWSDLDAYGHLNNARFLTLYEEARVAMMFIGGRARGVTSFEKGVVIARHEVDYLRPVDYGSASATDAPPCVRIELWVTDVRPARFTILYELFDGDAVASRALSVLVPYNLEAGRPRRLSAPEWAFLSSYTGSRQDRDGAGSPTAVGDG